MNYTILIVIFEGFKIYFITFKFYIWKWTHNNLCIGYENILPNCQKVGPINKLPFQLKSAKSVIYPDSILKNLCSVTYTVCHICIQVNTERRREVKLQSTEVQVWSWFSIIIWIRITWFSTQQLQLLLVFIIHKFLVRLGVPTQPAG
jgi:hypothetical protein